LYHLQFQQHLKVLHYALESCTWNG
jgi:hypothetical protein